MDSAVVRVWELGLWDMLFCGETPGLGIAFGFCLLLGAVLQLYWLSRCGDRRWRWGFAAAAAGGMLYCEVGCLGGGDFAVLWFALLPFAAGAGIGTLLWGWWTAMPPAARINGSPRSYPLLSSNERRLQLWTIRKNRNGSASVPPRRGGISHPFSPRRRRISTYGSSADGWRRS